MRQSGVLAETHPFLRGASCFLIHDHIQIEYHIVNRTENRIDNFFLTAEFGWLG